MKVTIKFSTENAAFDDNGSYEYDNIMSQAFERAHVDQTPGDYPLLDTNGNKVGTVTVSE